MSEAPPQPGDSVNLQELSHNKQNSQNAPPSSTSPPDVPRTVSNAASSHRSPPYNIMTKRVRLGVVVLIATAGFFSPITANIYFPVIPQISKGLHVPIESVNVTVSIFMIFQALSPGVWGAMSDVIGRRPVYLGTFTVFIAANYGLANINSYAGLLVLRCLQAAGSSSVMALGSASIGDIAAQHERGRFMGMFNVGPMLGPCIGPVIGGLLADRFDWHAVFWFLAVLSSLVFAIMFLFLPETLRSIVGNGSIPATGINVSLLSKYNQHQLRKASDDAEEPSYNADVTNRPQKKDVALILTYNSIAYTCFYCCITSLSASLDSIYGLSQIELGLCYFAPGTGTLVCALLNGYRLDHDYRKTKQIHKRKLEERGVNERDARFPIEQARLRGMPYSIVGIVVSTLAYGWTLDQRVHLAAPLVFQFLIGSFSVMSFNSISILIVDLFPGASASAVAANNLLRCLVGAGGTALIQPLINGVGSGLAFVLVACIVVLFSPTIWLEYRYGGKLHEERLKKLKAKKESESFSRSSET